MNQADPYIHQLNIQLRFGHSNYSCIPIFNYGSGWPIHSPIEYSVKVRPLRLFLSSNIQLWIRLTCAFTNWIFSQASATPIIPVFQYLIMNQADPYIHQLNIQSRFGHSNYSCIPIFNYGSGWPIHSPIEYSVKVQPLRLFLYSNI